MAPQPMEIDLPDLSYSFPSRNIRYSHSELEQWTRKDTYDLRGTRDVPDPALKLLGSASHTDEHFLQDWVSDAQAPWSAVKSSLAVPRSEVYQGQDVSARCGPDYGVQRSRIVPSDSGYGTHRSVESVSIFSGDYNEHDSRRPQSLEKPSYREDDRQSLPTLSVQDAPVSSASPAIAQHNASIRQQHTLMCSVCNKRVKNPSELKYGRHLLSENKH